MKLRSTNKARKVKLFWEKRARKMKKLKLVKQKGTMTVIPNTNSGFMKMWILPTITNIFSFIIVPMMTDLIYKTLATCN